MGSGLSSQRSRAGQFTTELAKCKYVLVDGESAAVAMFYTDI